MIDKTQVEEIKSRFDLISYAGQRSELHKVAAGEWAGPCPMCGGDDRFHVRADGWFCRHCKNEPWQDAIELVRLLENCSFADALARMAGNAFALPPGKLRPVESSKKEQPADWADKAGVFLVGAQQSLYSEDRRGVEYLTRRGLTPAIWRRFGLGYALCVLPSTWKPDTKEYSYPPQPAIIMPWYAGRRLVALRYRFLDSHTYLDARGDETTNKQGARYGSEFAGRVFGGQALARTCENLRTLIICEGEINAMSIYQVAGETKVDVLSLGSESQRLPPAVVDYALRFKHVMVWADEPETAKNLMGALPGAFGISSKALTGNKQDANDLLRAGHLGGYLTAWRFKMCQTTEQRDALYFDLWDATQFGAELDAGTLQVMRHIAPGQKEIDRIPIFRDGGRR